MLIQEHVALGKISFCERKRGMKVARTCEPASARLSLQAMRLSYFKNSDFTPSLQRNITLRVSSLSKLFY